MKEGINRISLMVKGVAMGVAEIIPGVSGGTIAFITGIYERLINSVTAFGPDLWKVYKSRGIKGVLLAIDALFLFYLLSGMILGAGVAIIGISYLIEQYPEPLWSFFFGLILASSVYIGRQLNTWSVLHISLLIVGGVLAYIVISISPSTGSTSASMLFFSGFVAITAFILPGISGSFILLMLGMYSIIIPTIKSFVGSPSMEEFRILAIFGMGCIVGLMLCSRLLTWTFKNYKDHTFAILTGFMIASLVKIWPWKNVLQILDKGSLSIHTEGLVTLLENPSKKYKILQSANVLPSEYIMGEAHVLAVIIFFFVGLLSVVLLSKLED